MVVFTYNCFFCQLDHFLFLVLSADSGSMKGGPSSEEVQYDSQEEDLMRDIVQAEPDVT